jgi:CHAT domain-containing protein
MVHKSNRWRRQLRASLPRDSWLAAVRKMYSRRSLVLAALLFFLSVGIAPVVAKISAPAPIAPSPIAQNAPDAGELANRANKLYQSGQFQQAAALWQQAVSAFAARGDRLNQAMALSNLSLTYQQLGQWEPANQAIAESLNLLQRQKSSPEKLRILAQTLDIQGQLQLAAGESEKALDTWQQAAQTYAKTGDRDRTAQSRLNQVQALENLGLYPRACKTLLEALELDSQDCKISETDIQTLKDKPDSPLKFDALRSLGDILRVTGELNLSEKLLLSSREVAKRLQSPRDESAASLSLGNTLRSLAEREKDNRITSSQKTKQALDYYKASSQLSASPIVRTQAQVNQLSLLLDRNNWAEGQQLWPQIQSQLAQLTPSRSGIYAQINFAHNFIKLSDRKDVTLPDNFQVPPASDLAIILNRAGEQANLLGDKRADSYALGTLGALYERNKNWPAAEKLTQQALFIAESIKAANIAYLWHWQLGRILKAQGDTQQASEAYKAAYDTLESLRRELVAVAPEVQFTFRDSVEPVYREFVELLLSENPTPQQLAETRQVIESLQLAELNNFFRDACVQVKQVQIDQQLDPTAGVIYTIILPERLEVILSLPDKTLRRYSTPVKQSEVAIAAKQVREMAVSPASANNLRFYQQVYSWIVRPLEADLQNSPQVSTLVFVLDGELRNIPMSVLHDGQKYLAEKYSIALTPGLQLLETTPLTQGQFKALTAGLTESVQGFSALPNVKIELQKIESALTSTKKILNQDFTNKNFETQFQESSLPVVHLATHAQFSSNPDETFILTWDGKVKVKDLDKLLRADSQKRSPELLVLSACETAQGDRRAALGLAGVAVRAGARSTLATLWKVADNTTAIFMGEFYRELANSTDTNRVTKAQALRRAQLTLLKSGIYQHPYYWAPYVLVGNWQ